MQKPTVIYSEEPIADIWKRLQRYTYRQNLASYHPSGCTDKMLSPESQDDIIASIEQAHEYYQAARHVSLHTLPLQLYYGSISLFRALYILLKGEIPDIDGHGMKLDKLTVSENIGETHLDVRGIPTGGLLAYASMLRPAHKLTPGPQWSLLELLGSVPDLFDMYIEKYGFQRGQFIIPVERLLDDDGLPIERVAIEHIAEMATFEAVENFKDIYLPIQRADSHFILKRKLSAAKTHISITAISGRTFFQAGHKKQQKYVHLPEEILVYMGLFILGTLSRYHPRIWGGFIRTTQFSERELVESFLATTMRKLPNRVLDMIEHREHVFTNARM